jgi:hypothetical protein
MANKNGKVDLRPLSELKKDGFGLPTTLGKLKLKSFALLSLRIALQAYFSTYNSMRHLHLFADPFTKKPDGRDRVHCPEYCSLYGQVVLHFQHFAELVCKDILRAQHDLLAIDAAAEPVLLYKLLNKEEISPSDYESLNSVEFRIAQERVLDLLKADLLDNRFAFFKEAKPLLDTLNNLRNRLLHRGTYILRYPALDELVGAYIIPFAKQVLSLKEYENQESLWKFGNLQCGIDPMEAIALDWKHGKYNLKKAALLKELGRAAYEAPESEFPLWQVLRTSDQQRAQRLAATELEKKVAAGLRQCPVCGFNTLVQYDEHETTEDEAGKLVSMGTFPFLYRCMCCTFEVDYDLDNPSDYGPPIPDFW